MTAIPNSRIEKSLRLLRENRVTEITARTFIVDGDTEGPYYVTIGEGTKRFCPCKWDGEGACAHILGANNYIAHERFEQNPLKGLRTEEHPNG